MAKKFEDVLSENLTDMIAIVLEYTEYRVEKVFVYASKEDGCEFANYFFQIHGHILKDNKMNDMLLPGEKKFDNRPSRQHQVIQILFEDFDKIKEACNEYKMTIPTEIKVSYDLRTRKFDSHLGYDDVWSNRRLIGPPEVMEEWMAEEQRKLDLGMSQ